jgi:hypothetical protein
MANVSRVNGLRPVGNRGQEFNGRVNAYFIPSTDGTAVYIGDTVKLAGASDTASAVPGTYPTVTKSTAATTAICGVVVGFAFNPLDLNISGMYRAASTNRYCLVADDPNTVFEVQTSNGTPAGTDVGSNVEMADAGGSTTTANSGITADVGTLGTGATIVLKIISFIPRPDNDDTLANAKYLVKINNHQFGSSTGTAGV